MEWTYLRKIIGGGENGGVDINGPKETHVYLARSSTPATPLEAAVASTGSGTDSTTIPVYGDPHPTTPAMKVVRITPRRRSESIYLWEITVDYEIPQENIDDAASATIDKFDIDFTVTGEERQVIVDHDAFGRAITNSARKPLSNPPPRIYYDETITITFKTDNLDPDLIAQHRGAINADQVTLYLVKGEFVYTRTFSVYTLMIGNISYSLEPSQNGSYHWNVTLPIHYRTKVLPVATTQAVEGQSEDSTNAEYGWIDTCVDRGFHHLAFSEAHGWRPIRNRIPAGEVGAGQNTDTEDFLNGRGDIITLGSDETVVESHLLAFVMHDYQNFVTGSNALLDGLVV